MYDHVPLEMEGAIVERSVVGQRIVAYRDAVLGTQPRYYSTHSDNTEGDRSYDVAENCHVVATTWNDSGLNMTIVRQMQREQWTSMLSLHVNRPCAELLCNIPWPLQSARVPLDMKFCPAIVALYAPMIQRYSQ